METVNLTLGLVWKCPHCGRKHVMTGEPIQLPARVICEACERWFHTKLESTHQDDGLW